VKKEVKEKTFSSALDWLLSFQNFDGSVTKPGFLKKYLQGKAPSDPKFLTFLFV